MFIKGRGAEILRKFRLPHILREPFKVLVRILVSWLAIWKPIRMTEMKVHCAFVKGGTRSVAFIGGTMWYIFDWKSHNKHRCALAKAGKTV